MKKLNYNQARDAFERACKAIPAIRKLTYEASFQWLVDTKPAAGRMSKANTQAQYEKAKKVASQVAAILAGKGVDISAHTDKLAKGILDGFFFENTLADVYDQIANVRGGDEVQNLPARPTRPGSDDED